MGTRDIQRAAIPRIAKLLFLGPEYAGNHFPQEMVDIFGVTLEQVCKFIDMKESYWGPNLMGASLYYSIIRDKAYFAFNPQLLISFHHEFGFQIFSITVENGESSFRLALHDRKTRKQPVAMDSQTIFYFPPNSFHSSRAAKEIVKTFVESRSKRHSQAVDWQLADDDFTDPDAWQRFLQINRRPQSKAK
jgi:hypothetical protein